MPFLLGGVVPVLQVLPGHFQLAFMTQCGVILIVAWSAIERWGVRALRALPSSSASLHFNMRAGGIALALASVFLLAAIQLWPTGASGGSGCLAVRFRGISPSLAVTPFHLVNFVAPGFFHRSPLWRPVVWTPFHTSPEELLAYIGLAPLFLAGMAVFRHWRRDAAVRLLAILFIATLVLSFGPFAPGFLQLIKLPGFSFFRCPRVGAWPCPLHWRYWRERASTAGWHG